MATASFERCGRYELRDVLGEGGMGTVYRAWDPDLAREVAVKIVHGWPLDDSHLERFRREAQLLARLPHPNIVSVFDVGSIGDEPFIVMELVDGRSLAETMAEGRPLPFEKKVRAAGQICDALVCAHAAGIIHRDVKPGNILLTTQGLAKLADFGIARLHGTSLTRPSVVVGSPAYLAPEVFDGQPADARSDIYGLAASLYEWLSGVRPHDVNDARAISAKVAREDARPLSDVWPDCPPSLERCVQRGLSRDPGARYQTADAMAADLRLILGESRPAASEFPARPEAGSRTGRLRRAVLAGCAFVAVLMASGLLWNGRAEPVHPAADAPSAATATPGQDGPLNPPPPDATPVPIRRAGNPPTQGGNPGPATREPAGELAEEDDEKLLPVRLPVGTALRAQVLTELRTDRSLAGHEFDAALSEPVAWQGQVVARAGTRVKGLVHEVGAGGRDTPPYLQLSLTALTLSDTDVPIRTALYRVVAPPTAGGESLRVLILGAALGAIAGAAIGGSDGAVTGGVMGATLSRPPASAPEPVVLTSPLTFKLAAPLPLPVRVP